MRVLVTGATGFIGQSFIPFLLKKGVTVRVLVRGLRQNGFPSEVEQYIGDLTNADSLKGAAADVDVLFHLGGHAHAWKEKDEEAINKHTAVNFMGTQNILNEGIRAGIKKFIFFSTIKAVADTEKCIDEKWDTQPNTPYGKAKRAAEEWVLNNCNQHAVHACILRLPLIYGPGVKGNLYQMLQSIDKGYFPAIPFTKNQRSLVGIYDVCEAAWLAAQSIQANGKVYFVTDNQSYSTHDIYSIMRHALGKSHPWFYFPFWLFKILALVGDAVGSALRRRIPFDSQAFDKLFGTVYCDSSCIQEELGFCPQYSLRELMPEIVRAYRG
ncbi:MAG TPA: NAD-dependent epimerase/dehydratase family protein [Gammaproteobacteria bacterium]|nr:MAG: hypothetical protein A3E83_06860 [Gammaproteobacteria bacterium RIFCSPHIGHO2_12_FULL_41_20]HLB43519.1 NAD-dependent epimerase/dehydratase family protein [Gammaproteobacteria bacterium]